MEDVKICCVLKIVVCIVEARIELVKIANVERFAGIDAKPPVPNPDTVEARVVLRNDVETRFKRFGEETKSAKLGVEIYPDLEIPVVVDCRVVSRNVVDTRFNKLGVETNPKRF